MTQLRKNSKQKTLFFLLNGKVDKIFESNHLNKDHVIVEKIDEKELSNFKEIKNRIRREKYDQIYFGTYDLRFQRFTFFMKYFIFTSKSKKGMILDEFGKKINFNSFSFLVFDIPKFIFELLYSTFILIKYSLKSYS